MPRPRWGVLYGMGAVTLAALTAIEVRGVPGVLQTLLRCTLALATFAAMALWVRFNRAALDLQNWCECAASKITVRVIQARRPVPEPAEEEDEEAEALTVARR
ncbi:MAG: hypothetical protein ACRDH5_13055 [bacterium]